MYVKREENEYIVTAYMISASQNFIESLKFRHVFMPQGGHNVLRSLCVNSRESAIHCHFPGVPLEKALVTPPSSPGASFLSSHNSAYWDVVLRYVVRINRNTAVTASRHSIIFCFAS